VYRPSPSIASQAAGWPRRRPNWSIRKNLWLRPSVLITIHSPDARAKTVVRLTRPAVWSMAVVCTVAISCWPKVFRTMSRPLDNGALE
jgi:hypothetical protein